jgi:hypothetical protein
MEVDMKNITAKWCIYAALVLTLPGCGNSGGGGGNIQKNQNNGKVIEIDVPAVTILGDITLNGGAFPDNQYTSGIISLLDTDNNQTPLTETYNGNYVASVVKGDYEALYDLKQGAGTVPSNKNQSISSGISLLIDQPFDINVTAYLVRFVFTLDGSPFPVTEYDDAVFYLQLQGSSERILLGNSHSPVDSAWFMAGTYDVIYELETGGSQVPVNQNAVVATVVIDDMTSGINVDVKTVDLRFNATLDGSPFPVSQYAYGLFKLTNSAGDIAELGESYNLPLDVKVIEGTYDVIYSYSQGANLPVNSAAVLANDVQVNSANAAQNINILTALITPQYTLDGGAFPVSEYQDAEIFLRGPTDKDTMLIGNTHDANPADVRIVRGNYDVIYRHETGDEVPINSNAIVQNGKVLNADQVLAVDVNSVTITGTFTLNGGNFPGVVYQAAEFYLKRKNSTDEFLLGLSYAGNGTARLIPGTYDVIYKYVQGNELPQNSENTVMADVLLDTTKSIRIDVNATKIAPVFTLNGGPFAVNVNEVGEFYLHGPTGLDRVYIGHSFPDNEALYVINGGYDVQYEYVQGSDIPVNSRMRIDTIQIP